MIEDFFYYYAVFTIHVIREAVDVINEAIIWDGYHEMLWK